MMNSAEQRWKDYQLVITIKNMLLCVERQYNDFHQELGKLSGALTDRSRERKDKAYEKVEVKKYESKKMEYLLKMFHVEIDLPKERYVHETNSAKWWRRFKASLKCARSIIHIAGGSMAMITNGAGMDGDQLFKDPVGTSGWDYRLEGDGKMSNMENMAIAGNHIKDIDFIIGNLQNILEENIPGVKNFKEYMANKLSEWNQAMYPLEHLQKMLTQVRGIQESVQAEGMKADERYAWNGVKMQLFRIFQQEQLIFRYQGNGLEDYKAEAYDVGTSSKIQTEAKKKDPDADEVRSRPLKRFLFTIYNTGTISPSMQGEDMLKKAHCVMYLIHEDPKKIQGFMHLKEYTELSEVAKLLEIDTDHYTFEACEVRGKTEDIVKGTVQVRLVEENKPVKWGPCAAWKAACEAVTDMDSFLGYSDTKSDCATCEGKGTVLCDKGECIKKVWLFGKHPCIEGTCYKHCPTCESEKDQTEKEKTDRCHLHKESAIVGWVYVENTATTAALELLSNAEKKYRKRSEDEKTKSLAGLVKLGLYQDVHNILGRTDDLIGANKIRKILQSKEDVVRVNDATALRSEVKEWLLIQLGSPDVTHSHLKELAILLVNSEKGGEAEQSNRKRFFEYDDKPCFNLISGIIQAREDIWQKNSIKELQTAVQQLKEGIFLPGTSGPTIQLQNQFTEEMKKQLKEEIRNQLKEELNAATAPLKEEIQKLKGEKVNKRGVALRINREQRTPNLASTPRSFASTPRSLPSTPGTPRSFSNVTKCSTCSGTGLPAGWTQHTSRTTGRTYYYNPAYASQYDRPSGSCEACKGSELIKIIRSN